MEQQRKHRLDDSDDQAPERKQKSGKAKILIILAAVLVVAAAAGGVTYWQYQRRLYAQEQQRISAALDVDVFYDGIFVDGIPLGGLTPDEARARIAQGQQTRIDEVSVGITMEDSSVIFTARDMNVSFDTEQVLEQAWKIGREGDRQSRYEYVTALPANPVELTTTLSVDPAPLEQRITAMAALYDTEPSDAAIASFNPAAEATIRFFYQQEEYGLKVDAGSVWESVRDLVDQKAWGQTAEVSAAVLEPEVTVEELMGLTQLVSHFESTMKRDSNREYNIRLACSRITGAVIMPGEEFSFNKRTGPRTYATGFKDAGIIKAGQPDEGVAGGVCQVSGTLFNALVMADLEITKRSHHSYELGYLTRGRDATVDYPSGTDLRCKNNGDTPVYLVMYTVGRQVIAEVYGVPLADGMTIDIDVVTLQTKPPAEPIYVADPEVPVGSQVKTTPHNYIKCQSYKIYKDAQGNEIRKEKLILDEYRAIRQEIHVNPASMPGAGGDGDAGGEGGT